ncbi:chordin-like protein 2 [Eriocheir sinensis]|uniref:chordin-like protein 2 n=1 Tax=Eriocheir sinensis TaxID=95602 RepID=UPI0021C5D342|nr:chordin-like protein 2 [Eriocheir sinensis]
MGVRMMSLAVRAGLLAGVILAGCSQGSAVCTAAEYERGEVWHPRLQNSEGNYCVTCRCLKEGEGYHYNCTSEPCPEGCTGGADEGECCSICSESATRNKNNNGGEPGSPSSSSSSSLPSSSPSSSSSSSSTSYSYRSTDGNGGGTGGLVADASAAGVFSSGGGVAGTRSCVVDGMMYQHGDTFSGNYSGGEHEKCQHCFCNDGVTQCRTKVCPPVPCSSPIYIRRDCCRVCRDDSTELDWDTMVSFSDPSAPKGTADHDCKIGGRYFVNGSIWHPVIGPFGEMDCVLCKCLNRRIDCSRLKCQSRDKLQCSKPVKVAGQCCPVCPLTLVTSTAPQVSGNTIRCLSERTQLAVWKNVGAGNNSRVMHYVFEPVAGRGGTASSVLHLHRMILRNGNLEKLDIYDISRDEFRNLRSTYTFSLFGGTTNKLMNKFRTREQRTDRRCKRKKRCSVRVPSLDRILKVRPATMRVRCARGEREI